MVRQPLPIGGYGKIARVDLGDGRWRAKARFRGVDGRTRLVQRDTPLGVRDKSGAQAEEVLKKALDSMADDVSDGAISSKTRLRVLAENYLVALENSTKAVRTKDSYSRDVGLMLPYLAELRVHEATPQRLGRILDEVAAKHGATTAKRCKTVLGQVLAEAVREGAIPRNPVRDLETPSRPKVARKTTRALTADELALLLHRLRTSTEPLPVEGRTRKGHTTRTVSQWADDVDLVDPVVMLAGTGLRRSELLGVRFEDVDLEAGTVAVTGTVVRAKGKGLVREDTTKTASSARTIAVPTFVVEMLKARRNDLERMAMSDAAGGVIFASLAGTLRDPDNLNGQWRRVRESIGFDRVTSHTFRRTVATRLDEAGLSARVAADMLGHSKVSMAQDVYQARRRIHDIAADALDLPAVSQSDG